MPRAPRPDAPETFHHVMIRGINRFAAFAAAGDRLDLLERLERKAETCSVECFAWAIMPNHVHLVLRRNEVPLARFMAGVCTGYARGFNLRHDRTGHLFENRYRSILIEDDVHLRTVVRYVHLNPLRAGIVASLDELAGHAWTGHAALLGRAHHRFQAVGEVLGWFGPPGADSRRRLLRWMADGIGIPLDPVADDDETRTKTSFRTAAHPAHRGSLATAAPAREAAEWLSGLGWSVETILAEVCRELRIDPDLVRSSARGRRLSTARAAVAHLSREYLDAPIARVACSLGISEGSASRCAARGRASAVGLRVTDQLRTAAADS